MPRKKFADPDLDVTELNSAREEGFTLSDKQWQQFRAYEHAQHERWIAKVGAQKHLRFPEPLRAELVELQDWGRQCLHCVHYRAVNGDWGVCSCPEGPFDALLMFEHDTCPMNSHPEAEEARKLWGQIKPVEVR